MAYRDELEAALARADAAERELRMLKEDRVQSRPESAKTNWWRRQGKGFKHDTKLLFWVGLFLVAMFGILYLFSIRPAMHVHDWTACYVKHEECKFGTILCNGHWIVVGQRRYNQTSSSRRRGSSTLRPRRRRRRSRSVVRRWWRFRDRPKRPLPVRER